MSCSASSGEDGAVLEFGLEVAIGCPNVIASLLVIIDGHVCFRFVGEER